MSDQAILQQMGIRSFELKNSNIINGADKELVAKDIYRNLPVFVFCFDQSLAKEYLFNLVGYLRYVSYPCYWENEPLSMDEKSRMVVIGGTSSKRDLTAYPSRNGKKALWSQIVPYVNKLTNAHGIANHIPNTHIVLESPIKFKWLYNLAGFLSFNQIAYSWYEEDAAPNSVFIGAVKNSSILHSVVINEAENENDQKRMVFKELIDKKFLKISDSGRYVLGEILSD